MRHAGHVRGRHYCRARVPRLRGQRAVSGRSWHLPRLRLAVGQAMGTARRRMSTFFGRPALRRCDSRCMPAFMLPRRRRARLAPPVTLQTFLPQPRLRVAPRRLLRLRSLMQGPVPVPWLR